MKRKKKINDVPPELKEKLERVYNQDLKGKTVVLYRSFFNKELENKRFEKDNLFLVKGGFGADGDKKGRACFGVFGDGESTRVERPEIEYILNK